METAECDVLIAGSGAAGLTAAITAAHYGLDVLVCEKEPVYGGTTAYSAGVIWIPGNSYALAEGIADRPEDALTYMRNEAGNGYDAAKAEAFVREAPKMLDFMVAHSHVRYQMMPTWSDYHPDKPGASQGGRSLLPEPFDGRALGEEFDRLRAPIATMMLFGGMSVSRTDIPHLLNATRSVKSGLHVLGMLARYGRDRVSYRRGTAISNGNALVARLRLTMLERNIPLWLNAPVTDLIEGGGRVVGARVMRDGKSVVVTARKAVMLASGGFPRNEESRARYYPHVHAGQNHTPLAPPGNTGDGARLASALGADFARGTTNPAAWTPVSLVPNAQGGVTPFPHFIDRCKPGFIAVDKRGRRFGNEADSYHDFVPAMMKACTGDARVEAFLICDHRAFRRYGMGVAPPSPMPYGKYLRNGYLTRGASLAELAGKLGIDRAGLEAQVRAFNANAARGEDPEFGKGTNSYHHFGGDPLHKPNPNLAPLAQAPFYAVRLEPSDLGTFQGLATDASGRVLRGEAREPIGGLYAVGNDMASVMGGAYPGAGITIGPAMTFGYVAARAIAGAS